MLTLLTYATSEGLKRHLDENLPESSRWLIVVPHPAKADTLRKAWAHQKHVDVVTFATFAKNLSKESLNQNKTWRKSRLLLQLNAFRHALTGAENTSYGHFMSAYQIFSDLRSYTNAPEFPEEILEGLNEETTTLAQLFHQACQRLGILDEHASVFELAHTFRSSEEAVVEGNPIFIFWGFSFLTPAQVTLIEAIAIRHSIVIPIHRDVFTEAHVYDWPKVLELSAHEVLHVADKAPEQPPLRLITYSSGHISGALSQWRPGPSSPGQIVLGSKRVEPDFLQLIPFTDVFLKYSIDIGKDARDALFEKWHQRLNRMKTPPEAKEIIQWINEETQTVIASKDLSQHKILTTLLQLTTAIDEVPGCLDGQQLDEFLLLLLQDVANLDAPRNSMIPLLKDQPLIQVYSLQDLDALDKKTPVALCLDSGLGSLKSDSRPYSPEMEKVLSKLGPVKRPELDFLFVKSELNEVLGRRDLTIIMEEGLTVHDLGWKKVLSAVSFDEVTPAKISKTVVPEYGFFAPQKILDPVSKKTSASLLQDFYDCPRKYYASRVEKLIPRVEFKSEIDALNLGILEHKLVELAWPKGENWWKRPGALEGLAQETLGERSLNLKAVSTEAVIKEVSLFAMNALERLELLKRAFPDIKFRFEVPLEGAEIVGSIDCLGVSSEVTIILDFKRSHASYPGFKAWTQGMDKIQLWFYLNSLSGENKSIAIGYLFLKDIDKSWLAFSHADALAKLEAVSTKWGVHWESPTDALKSYQVFEEDLLQRLRSETVYAPRPRIPGVCDLCALKPLCPASREDVEEAE